LNKLKSLFKYLLLLVAVQSYASVNFSTQRGYYSTSFQLTLSTPITDANIIYTVDNSKPTPTNGIIYDNEPILVSSTKTIKAISFIQNDTSRVAAHTYIFLDEILETTYMDTSITKNEIYELIMKESFLSLPAISIKNTIA